MQPKKIRWASMVLPTIGGILAVLGAALIICRDDLFHFILSNELKLSPTSRGFEMWKEPSIPLYFDIYLFNWTNPEDIEDHETKPIMAELGPYRFRETRKKVNITWNPENSTVSYRIMRHWYFDAEGSNGTLEDEVTTLNVVAASAVYTARSWGYAKQKGVALGMTIFQQTISVTKTAGELLFEGYSDALLDFARSMPSVMESGPPPVDKFGWFYERNGSVKNDGYFNMGTGQKDFSNFGKVKNWNYNSNTSFFPGKCGEVKGSAGEFYSTRLKKTDISMFSPDLCRTLKFEYEKTVDVVGIQGYKYSGGAGIMDNGTEREENKCYCVGECQPSGALNVSSCRFGSPAFISFPHFLEADPYYLDAVEGMSPDPERHTFYMVLEPTSGIPLEVAARFQLNVLLYPIRTIGLFSKVPRLFLPIMWFEQRVTLNESLAGEIDFMLKSPTIAHAVSATLFVVGVLLILWTPVSVNVKACLKVKKSNKRTPPETVLNNLRTPVKEAVSMLPKLQEEVEPQDEAEADTLVIKVTNDLSEVRSKPSE